MATENIMTTCMSMNENGVNLSTAILKENLSSKMTTISTATMRIILYA